MLKEKFTKGPWVHTEDDKGVFYIENPDTNETIGYCYDEDDANLIKTSTEMYEALDYLADLVEDNEARLINELLAKARGEHHE